MKSHLTENAVLTLYNQGPQTASRVQVIFLTHLNKVLYLRVTDSKYLSPVVVIMKIMERFLVGDVIMIKKVQLQSSGSSKECDEMPLLDIDMSHLVILEYQVVETRKNVGVFYYPPILSGNENSYWNSLSVLKHCLIKGEGLADVYFKDVEKRLMLLRPDCNLLRERGNELYKKQKYIKAIIHYDMAKQKDPYDARVWNNSSQAYFFNNDYHKAKRDALIALKLDPFNKKAYYRAGQAMEMAGDITSAVEVIEAGLFVCGKCEDLEKLHRQLKDSEILKMKNVTEKAEEKPNNKKTNINVETSDMNESSVPASFVTNAKKTLKSKDSPLRKVKENTAATIYNNNNRDASLSRNYTKCDSNNTDITSNAPILSFLEGARRLFEMCNYQDALELFKVATASKVSNSFLSQKEMDVIKYLVEVCKIKTGAEDMESVKNFLMDLLNTDSFPYPPAVHYWLAKTYEKLDNQDKVIHHANSCILLIENNFQQYNLFWPGTKDPIKETNLDELKKWFNEGSWRSAPFAKCRHVDCISTQGHSLAKTEIYKSDLDFRGYVEVECEEMCSICYHPCCWKAIKEKEEQQLIKKTDKDYLGLQCFTPDCCGKIYSIKIIDENCRLRNEIAKDKKERKTAQTSKLKKKKEKKRTAHQGGKFDDKKKTKCSETESLIKLEENEDVAVANEEAVINKRFDATEKGNGSLTPVEPLNFEGSNYKILRPNDDDDEEEFQVKTNKKNKNKKKKKKGRPAQISILPDEVEEKVVQNEYLNHLKALRQLREALENESVQLSSSVAENNTAGLKNLPDCILDPDRPFYLPKHLQENPVELERILRMKMVMTSSSEIQTESVTTLLEFVYDWLKAHSPMHIADSRVRDYISENFPPNAVAYVNKCGGIRNFLLQSFKFAIIDDIICVSEQVICAQEMAIQMCLDRFRSSKYLISDGHKAMKLSHLLDDTKSTCSSTSSQSNVIVASSTSTESGSSLPKPDYAASATPYKTAAMAKVPASQKTPRETETKPVDLFSKLIRPKPVPPPTGSVTKQPNLAVSKKPKLKTMDMDAFEVVDACEIGQLFSQQKPTINNTDKNTEKSDAAAIKGDMLFQSDEETETDIVMHNNLANPSKQLKQPSVSEFKDTISKLEARLASKDQEMARLSEEQQLLTIQNQELNDRVSQIKMKSNVEISALKKGKEDAQELTKITETNFETYKNQKEGELRKLVAEKSKYQEEVKTFSLKIDSLQLTIDQLNSSKSHFEEEAKQKSIQLSEQQMNILKYQETAATLEERSRDAEFKYLSIKKDIIKLYLEKTKKRLTAEVKRMRELLPDAFEDTLPDKSTLIRSIGEWEETISKLNNTLQAVTDDGQRYLECIRSGHPLSTLPPGDLQVPSVPDLMVTHLLYIGKPVSSLSKKLPNHSVSSSAGGFISPFNVRSQIDFSTGIGGSFSFGQLGVGATPKNNEGSVGSNTGTIEEMNSSRASDLSFGIDLTSKTNESSLGFGSSRYGESSLLGPRLGDTSLGIGSSSRVSTTSHGVGINSRMDDGLGVLGTSLAVGSTRTKNDRTLVGSFNVGQPHIGENPLNIIGSGRIGEGLRSTPRQQDGSASLLMNGVSPVSLLDNDLTQGGSADSSPILMPPSSVSGASYSDSNQIFVGQLPWNFTEDHLKSVFSKYGEVVIAAVHNKGHTVEGKPVPKCGFVTFRTQQERDYVLSAGPITLGNHTLNIQAKETKRGFKINSATSLGPIADLPLMSSSSNSLSGVCNPSGVSVSKPNSGSAFGLQSLLDASKRAAPRTLATPTTPTVSKPKFQNLRSSGSVGAIGTLPPKVVRPIPRPGLSSVLGLGGNIPLATKEDAVISSASYKRLMEECKKKFGSDYPEGSIHKAIRDVRENNKNSLSGLALETILEQVDVQLRSQKRLPSKSSVAPWAQLSQISSSMDWQERDLDSICEDDCAICMERLSSNTTMPLQCGHIFHIKCIKHWLSQKSDCPICRQFSLNCDDYPSLSTH